MLMIGASVGLPWLLTNNGVRRRSFSEVALRMYRCFAIVLFGVETGSAVMLASLV